jgi:hypothetical protein
MKSSKSYPKLTSFSKHLATDANLSELRNGLNKPVIGEKERRIIHQLLPNLNESVQIMCSYSVDSTLLIRTDNAGVASRLRFILPQLRAQLGLKPEQLVKVICRPAEPLTQVNYWQANTGSMESGNVLMSAASCVDQSSNVDLANALRRLAATIARDD